MLRLESIVVAGNNFPDAAQKFLSALTELCEQSGNDWYRVYLIRKLGDRQGVEKVQTLVKDPQFSWLFPAEIQQQVLPHISLLLTKP